MIVFQVKESLLVLEKKLENRKPSGTIPSSRCNTKSAKTVLQEFEKLSMSNEAMKTPSHIQSSYLDENAIVDLLMSLPGFDATQSSVENTSLEDDMSSSMSHASKTKTK